MDENKELRAGIRTLKTKVGKLIELLQEKTIARENSYQNSDGQDERVTQLDRSPSPNCVSWNLQENPLRGGRRH